MSTPVNLVDLLEKTTHERTPGAAARSCTRALAGLDFLYPNVRVGDGIELRT
jgi:hypothetical protein